MDSAGTGYEEVRARSGAGGYLFAALYVAFGAISILLAVDEEFARDKAAFASDAWRGAFALVGAAAGFLGLRAFVRAIRGETRRLTPELHRRAALRGKVLFLIGVTLILVAAVEPLGERSVAPSGWVRPMFIGVGAFFVLQGLVFQWNPTKFIRQQRVAKGQGRPGTARIVRASDTGVTVNEAPQVRIEFELEVGGERHLVSDKIVMQRARLALLIPGSTVNVLVDQVDPNVFHVDWDSWRGPDASA